MKSHMILAVAALFMVTSSLATKAQTAPLSVANAPDITQGPWTSANPGSSKSQCNPGEYVVGIETEGAPSGAKRCVGCVLRFRVICQRYGI